MNQHCLRDEWIPPPDQYHDYSGIRIALELLVLFWLIVFWCWVLE